ncbi:MAG: DUF1684 domain-containing protein, partial [Nitrososphaerota archaeon]|nr:DUF1684 domain-containing protein [Nitrososphaerota archaeon]
MAWIDELQQHRNAKDYYLKANQESPLSHDERASFKGLNYFPASEKLRIRTNLHRNSSPDLIMISTSKGTSREFSRFGFFEFEVDGNIVKLHMYKSLDRKEDNELFIPFKDKTNGLETYSAGRYLDLEINPVDYDDCLIDFNYSYNPFCA